MSETVSLLKQFVAYAGLLEGDEKGEAQVFCDRLFQAFGHKGYKEAGATLEYRIKKNSTKGTSFADLVWKPRVLIEMKKRGEKIAKHYKQAFDYWLNAVPDRPRYVVICNFDELWIYDFDYQLGDPVDRVKVVDLTHSYPALNFLFQDDPEPIFGNDKTKVSQRAASQMAALFKKLTSRNKNPVAPKTAQRFVLQLVISMFAEDIDLMPAATITAIVRDCLVNKQTSYDLFGGLFAQMNNPVPATGGRFKGVPFFNGGLFSEVYPIDLKEDELELIGWNSETGGAATEDWSKVNPAIFGTLFEQSIEAASRHQHGRHFTSEADIHRVVGPTIVQPWMLKVAAATTMKELIALRTDLSRFKVLDPACGSGNFLYVAFRELARIDLAIMHRLQSEFSHSTFEKQAKLICAINTKSFFGLDNDPFAVELAKVTLMLAKKLALDSAVETLSIEEQQYSKGTNAIEFDADKALPLDNLDKNIVCADALFANWPPVDAIVGNPPYQAKNKAQVELSAAYLHKVRARYPDVDGRADYCVYWFRITHDHLKPGQRAGLVGTNTIRQNYSRMAGLDYIDANGGCITEAVSSMIWPGEAIVHVSVVNWLRGNESGLKRLYSQEGNQIGAGWHHADFETIGPSLSFNFDVSKAFTLKTNARTGNCFQGITHGHRDFLVPTATARQIIDAKPRYAKVLKPFLIADDLVGELESRPTRYVINFEGLDQLDAAKYPLLFKKVRKSILPDRQKAASAEIDRNGEIAATAPNAKGNQHHRGFLNKWWLLSYGRKDLTDALSKLNRYIVCGRVTKRPIFEFVSTEIQPNDALTVFPFEDDYTFGILQSGIHWSWFNARCSTLKSDPRYTSNTVFDSFPWPQEPTVGIVKVVAAAGIALRAERAALRAKHNLSFRELYRALEQPGNNTLKQKQSALDGAVRKAYGMSPTTDPLVFLLKLNKALNGIEKSGGEVAGPGLPNIIKNKGSYISADCIRA